jgi:hypothetical protein
MAKKDCPFKIGDYVLCNDKEYEVIALCGSGLVIIYVWPKGKKMEGTNRISLKTTECVLLDFSPKKRIL